MSINTEMRANNSPDKTRRAYRRYQKYLKDKKLRRILNDNTYNPARGYLSQDKLYIQYPRNSNAQRDAKKACNRKVRRYKNDIPNGNSYRKIAEYWWQIY